MGPHKRGHMSSIYSHIKPFSKITNIQKNSTTHPHRHCPHFLISCFIFFSPFLVLSRSESIFRDRMSSRQGDWMCGACQHLNFQKRDSCQRCSCPKYATAAEISSYSSMPKAEVLAGDWYCGALNCGAHNYASRTSCYRCCTSRDYCGYGAGMMASTGYAYDAIPGWKTGDWICNRLGCGMHNYASRTECYKCQTPRDFGGAM